MRERVLAFACGGGECAREPAPPAGESPINKTPFLDGFEVLLRPLKWIGTPIFTVLGWILIPFGILRFAASWLAGFYTFGLEATYALTAPASDLIWCSDPVLIAAACLVVVTRTLTLPIHLKAARSVAKMRALQPAIRKLQKQHRDDRQLLNEKMMEFYRKNQVNPLGGCIPVVAVGFIFYGLYQLLRGVSVYGVDGTFAPKFVHDGSALYDHLDSSHGIEAWGMNLLTTLPEVGTCRAVLPYVATFIVLSILTYFEQRPPSGATTAAPLGPRVAFGVISVAMTTALPMFIVLLSAVERAIGILRNRLIAATTAAEYERLRNDPEFQINMTEIALGEILDRSPKPPWSPEDGVK